MRIDNTPRLYLIAATSMRPGMHDWLYREYNSEMAWDRINRSTDCSEGGIVIEMAARSCYRSFDLKQNENLTRIREKHDDYMLNIVEQEHGSCFAHAHITIAFCNVSRVFTHEMVRHAIGNAFSQESGRFVPLKNFVMRFPLILAKYKDKLARKMQEVDELLTEIYDEEMYGDGHQSADILKKRPFSWTKEFQSALRRFAPTVNTNIVVTFNWRSFRWFVSQRSAEGVEEEMREIAVMAFDLVKEECPDMFLDLSASNTQHTPNGDRRWVTLRHPKI